VLLGWDGGRNRLFGGGGNDDLLENSGRLDGGPGDDRCFTDGPLVNCEPIRRGGTLLPGAYELVRFEPGFTFEVAARGWVLVRPDGPGAANFRWDAHKTTIGGLTFQGLPSVVWEPEGGPPVAAPNNLFAWLASHPCLQAQEPAQPVAIGSASGLAAEFTGLCDSQLWPECARPDGDCAGTLGVSEGGELWLAIVTVGQVELVVARTTPSHATSADRLEFKQAADELLATVVFTPG
jgi:hypothetical protein